MKKMFLSRAFYFLLFTFPLTKNVLAQNVGIGTTNPLNKLHIAGGLRVDTLANNIDSGLLRHDKFGVVYSLKFTGNVTDVLHGDGTFGSGGFGSVGWLLTGNAGTNPATHFIGTTDVQPLKFRVNNMASGEINNGGTTAFGYQALFSNTTGNYNTANGYNALYSNTTGNYNAVNGSKALYSNTLGYNNTANGYQALYNNTIGIDNSAYGVSALYFNTLGNDNTANGFDALFYNSSGCSNVAVGTRALHNNTVGQNLVAVGDSALYNQAVNSSSLYFNTAIG